MTTHPRSVRFHFGALVGRAPAMQQLFEQLARIAATNGTVLIEGAAGTGKRLVAQEIVRQGARARRPPVFFDCADNSQTEVALFGHDHGVSDGALMRARGGTLVLEEVSALPRTAQARLVRFIETGCALRFGAQRPQRIDVRIIATTREDLATRCEQRRFRHDLFFCLRPRRVRVPSLCERFEDLPLLVEALGADEHCPPNLHFDHDFIQWLRCRPWRGNLRELRNVLERVRVLGLASVMNEPDEPPAAIVPRLVAAGGYTASPEQAWVVNLLRKRL